MSFDMLNSMTIWQSLISKLAPLGFGSLLKPHADVALLKQLAKCWTSIQSLPGFRCGSCCCAV